MVTLVDGVLHKPPDGMVTVVATRYTAAAAGVVFDKAYAPCREAKSVVTGELGDAEPGSMESAPYIRRAFACRVLLNHSFQPARRMLRDLSLYVFPVSILVLAHIWQVQPYHLEICLGLEASAHHYGCGL